MNLPNTMLIGAQKAGTSSLYNWLAQHPDIFAPEVMKDFHYFTLDELHQKGLGYLGGYYKDHKNEKIILKGAVNYVYLPFTAKRLFDFDPKLKFLVVLRNPVDRALSAYHYFYKLGMENLDFENALEREENGQLTSYRQKADFGYLGHGLYYQQLQQYFQYFPKENFKILIYEELIKNKLEAVQDIFRFLEIESNFVPEFHHLNKTGQARYRWLNQFLFGDNLIKKVLKKTGLLERILPLEKRIAFGNYLREKNVKKNPEKKTILNREDVLALQTYFADDVEKLSSLINKDLKALWFRADFN